MSVKETSIKDVEIRNKGFGIVRKIDKRPLPASQINTYRYKENQDFLLPPGTGLIIVEFDEHDQIISLDQANISIFLQEFMRITKQEDRLGKDSVLAIICMDEKTGHLVFQNGPTSGRSVGLEKPDKERVIALDIGEYIMVGTMGENETVAKSIFDTYDLGINLL